MKLNVHGHGVSLGDALRVHIEERLLVTVEKYFSDADSAHVTVSRDGALFFVETRVHAGKRVFVQGRGRSEDPYAAFDEALLHIGKRLRRNKRRLRSHHPGHARPDTDGTMARQVVFGNDDHDDGGGGGGGDEQKEKDTSDNGGAIIAELDIRLETLSVSEAVMRMDLEDLPALVFYNVRNGRPSVVHRREDGNTGWIEIPEDAPKS